MKKLNGKVAVVTGASKGIGAAIAKEYAAQGASVVVNYSSDKDGADRVVKEIVANDGKAIAVHANISKSAEVQKLFATAKDTFGRLDILVNNAGVFKFSTIDEVTEEEFHRQFNINVLGLLLGTQEASKHFDAKGGSIINISSVISTNPVPGSAIYAGTKGAVDTINLTLARELAPRNIRVNSIAPGPVETEGTHAAGMIGSDLHKTIIEQTPLKRMGQPEDIARIALFLATDEAGWITGERIHGSGGTR